MDVLEVSAKTVEEAIEKALDELDVTRDQVKVTVISEGKAGGLFGFGSEEAKIRVEVTTQTTKPPVDIHLLAAETLDKLLKLLEVDGKVVSDTYPDEGGQGNSAPVAFNIEGDDLGILIGRRGQTLSSLQYILRLIVGHQTENWIPIIVDAEGYKQRRHNALKALALRMADHVKTRGAPFTLEPMPAYERRIVHLALADHPAVYTESIGEGESRKVVIRPKQRGSSPRAGDDKPRNGYSQPGNGYNQRPNYQTQRGGYSGQRSGGYNSGQRNSNSRPRRPSPPPY